MSCCGVFIMPAELTGACASASQSRRRMRRTFEFRGWHALLLLAAFFALVASVNAVMLTLAIRTMPGLDARNGFDPSQRYNAEIKAAAAQEARGWRAEAGVVLANGEAALSVAIVGRDGAPEGGLLTTASFRHPSDRRRDRAILLNALGDGRFAGRLREITPGAWDLVIEARPTSGGDIVFASRRRIVLKG
jgi:nitrogen fixation protein FixH